MRIDRSDDLSEEIDCFGGAKRFLLFLNIVIGFTEKFESVP